MIQTIYLGAGCFWCTEAVFAALKGVRAVSPGYMGGSVPSPTYEQVCGGKTGHVEVAKIEFDSEKISVEKIFEVFFVVHDPTSLNKQGADVGTQYKSVIFFTNNQQRDEAIKLIEKLSSEGIDVVTTVEPATEFYEAEDYHKKYYETHRDAMYCQVVIEPKLAKLRQKFFELL